MLFNFGANITRTRRFTLKVIFALIRRIACLSFSLDLTDKGISGQTDKIYLHFPYLNHMRGYVIIFLASS